jgi:hypothetical protein
MTDREILLELMFRAMIEIRADAYESKSTKAFKLADLFHNLPAQLLQETDEREMLEQLRERARIKGVEPWLDHACAEITKVAAIKMA